MCLMVFFIQMDEWKTEHRLLADYNIDDIIVKDIQPLSNIAPNRFTEHRIHILHLPINNSIGDCLIGWKKKICDWQNVIIITIRRRYIHVHFKIWIFSASFVIEKSNINKNSIFIDMNDFCKRDNM